MNKFACVLALTVGVVVVGTLRAGEDVPLDKLPKAVAEAAAKRFPKVEITGASKGKDGEKVVYEVSLKTKDGKKIDANVTEAGAITQIEQEIDFKDLPKAVAKTFEEKYPKAKYEVVESVTRVADGKEKLEYYEAVLIDGDKKKWEVEVLPDGKLKGATEVKK